MSSTTRSESLKLWVPRLAMMALAFGSSVGIYHFSLLFYSERVAQVIAGSFDLTYLGLAFVKLRLASDKMRREAVNVARTACGTAMLIVTLAGLFHLRPELLENKPLWGDIALSLVHGVPLSFLAYRMSNLILHPSDDTGPREPQQGATGATVQPRNRLRLRRIDRVIPAALAAPATGATIMLDGAGPEVPQLVEPNDRTRQIVKLWNEGNNKTQVAAEMQLSRTSITNHLKVARAAGLHVREESAT